MPRSKTTVCKTRKAVAKRFKVTAKGKVLSNSSGRRHLSKSKNRKRMRHLAKTKVLSESEYGRIENSLPFGGRN